MNQTDVRPCSQEIAKEQNPAGNEGTSVYASKDEAPRANQSGGGQPQEQHVVVVRVMPLSSVYNDPNSDARDGDTPFAASSFSNKRIRQAFIQKVYLILTAMLLVTVGVICIFVFVDPLKEWVRDHWWLWLFSYLVYFTLYMVLTCCETVTRSYPANYICLAIVNLAFSCVCATISCQYSTWIVLVAAGITALVCMCVSIFAIQTKIDFTSCYGLMCVLAVVLIMFALAVTIVYYVAGPNYILTCVYGAVASLVIILVSRSCDANINY